MVSNLIGDLKQEAEDHGVSQAKDALAKGDKILDGGPARTPADIAAEEAKFTRGDDLSTPDGDAQKTSTSPAATGQPAKVATLSTSKKIEFIHFGIVHQDLLRNFDHTDSIDDLQTVDMSKITGSRAIMFRAGLEREAVLLGALVTGTQMAFKAAPPDVSKMHQGDKTPPDASSGALDKLLSVGSDLVGGASSGAAQTAGGGDLSPFLDKLNAIWSPLNQASIQYDALHDAGIKLHEVRVNLRAYVRGQIKQKESGPDGKKQGLLSDLPVLGSVKIPGALGDIVGFMQKVTSKVTDVKTQMIFQLLIAMGPAIDSACHQASIDAIRNKVSPIYPIWFLPPPADAGIDHSQDKIADYDPGNVLGGDLGVIPGVGNVNQDVKNAANNYYNNPINQAAKEPMAVIDFLKKDVKPAPGSAYIADVFQVSTAKDATPGPLAGGGAIGKVAFTAFGQALGGAETVPSFLSGFVETMVTEVFQLCAEFLRAVYEKLCSLAPTDVISTDELLKAGREHILLALVDLALQKSGLDALIGKLSLPNIPKPPFPMPPGVTWPNAPISAQPILAELKSVLTDKLGPYMNPVVDYVMAGLAERLNAQRSWATPMAMTMEAHVAQLPGEITTMFIGLFGPLWSFLNDTLMGAVNNAMKKVLGPAGDAVGLAKDGLGKVGGVISDAEKKADQAKSYAKNVEDKVGQFLGLLKNVGIGGDKGLKDVNAVSAAGAAIGNAVGANPFAGGGDDKKGPKVNAATNDSSFQPSGRLSSGTGVTIDQATLDKVLPDLKWDAAGGDAASGGAVKS